MKKEIRSTLLLIGILVVIWVFLYLGNKWAFSSSWNRTYVNGKEVVHRVPDTFKDCATIDELTSAGRELQKELSQEKLTKIQYLDTIFRAHCIDYDKAEVSPDLTGEEKNNQKIITTAIELWVLQGNSENPFQPNSRISKIEALAFLFRLSGLELKGNMSWYNFRDVGDDWKRDVAAKATHLDLVYTSTSKNRFYPNAIMNQWDAYKILKQTAKYYR